MSDSSADLYDVCPICRSHNINLHRANIKHFHYPIQGLYQSKLCQHCGVEWVSPMPSKDQISSFYPSKYYAHQSDEKPSFWQKLIKFLNFRVRSKEPKFDKVGSILDIGCGTGDALELYKALGWVTLGVNFGQMSSSKVDISEEGILEADFLELDFGDRKFDYVRMNHTLEHLSNPVETIDKAYELLKPGGVLFVAVPNSDSFLYKVFKSFWWNYGLPCHLFVYNKSSLTHLLVSAGFQVKSFKFNSDYAGITGSLQIFLNRKSSKNSNQGVVFQSKLIRVSSHFIAKLLDVIKLGDCVEVISIKPE